MAVVWRAFDPKLEREVAVKEPVIPSGTSPTIAEEMGARFVREGKAAAQLNHPGIVTIHAADVYDGRPAIVMELIEGETLGEILARGPLSAAASAAILDQLLDAMAYAHARGVVHRDVKPDNVFVTGDGRVKLADFGIAHVGGGQTMTQAGTLMGTPGYMAPEQVTGSPVDARADIFAIGAIGYEMLTGYNPFGATTGDAPTTVMYRIVHEEPPAISPFAFEGMPSNLSPVLMTALAKDPADRFVDAGAFRAALAGGPIVTGRSTGEASVTPPPGRSISAWMPYAGVIAVLLIVGVVAWPKPSKYVVKEEPPSSSSSPSIATSIPAGGGAPSAPAEPAAAIYTPARKSATRQELMDAARSKTGASALYMVWELYVQGDWAVGELSPVGSSHNRYSDVFVWHRDAGAWQCLTSGGDVGESDSPAQDIRSTLVSEGVSDSLVNALKFK